MFIFLAAAFGAIALAHTAPFPFLLEAIAPAPSLWHVSHQGGSPTVYLTFDDGPNPTTTPDLLDVLARERVPATFFLIDRNLTDETAPIVRRMFEEGHAVALHSHTRALMLMSPERLAETLRAAADRITGLTGGTPCRMFRPHAGWRSGMMYAGLARGGYALAGWGWLLWDWNWFRERTAASVVRRVVGHASSGAIVVMHDGNHKHPKHPRADRRYAVEATSELIPALRARGFSFDTICHRLNP